MSAQKPDCKKRRPTDEEIPCVFVVLFALSLCHTEELAHHFQRFCVLLIILKGMLGTHVGDFSFNKKLDWKKQNYECLAKTNFERKLNFLKMFPWAFF